jgi:hypothetical protein
MKPTTLIAKKYNISPSQVGRIKNKEAWLCVLGG